MTTLEFQDIRPAPLGSSVATQTDLRESANRQARRSRRWLRFANVVLLVAFLVAAGSALGSVAGWWRVDTVLTGSMRPGIQPGDVEILRPEPVTALRVGQIVTFHPPKDPVMVTHRVVAVRHGSGRDQGIWITTKGDANNVDDPWGSVRVLGSTVWVVHGVVPSIGYLSVWIRTPLPHLLMILLIVALVCTIALEMIWRS
jgi:signal peptidase